MPAQTLPGNSHTVKCAQYCIMCVYTNANDARADIEADRVIALPAVGHVGLLAKDTDATASSPVQLIHLRQLKKSDQFIVETEPYHVQIVGSPGKEYAIPFTDDTRRWIELVVSKCSQQKYEYIAHPPYDLEEIDIIDYDNKRSTFTGKMNCVGFVLKCYEMANVTVPDHSEISTLPLISLADLSRVYPFLAKALGREGLRKRMGLLGSGPWPIMMAGYLPNSMRHIGPVSYKPDVTHTDFRKLL